jgi:hypothetical protein
MARSEGQRVNAAVQSSNTQCADNYTIYVHVHPTTVAETKKLNAAAPSQVFSEHLFRVVFDTAKACQPLNA